MESDDKYLLSTRRTHLSLHVHDDDSVGTVADDELFSIARKWMDAVYGRVSACCTSKRLERVRAFRWLHVPHFNGSVRTRTENIMLLNGLNKDSLLVCIKERFKNYECLRNNVMSVYGEDSIVHEWTMTSKLLESLARLETMNTNGLVERRWQQLTVVTWEHHWRHALCVRTLETP